ncbi:MAG: hypothetical protein JXB25_04670 [Deltaproteobacteria bacterium]|nr:hypothetical protein [Deltaproteobacteria bacterium]
MKMVIIGGGRAARIIIDHFATLKGYEIAGVVDPVAEAPGMVRARELGIETTADKAAMIGKKDVQLVFELTGRKEVEEEVQSLVRPDQQLIPSLGAKIACDLIVAHDGQSQKLAEQISHQFSLAIQKIEETLTGMKDSGSQMNHLLRHGYLVSLNAKVEAARAGQAGKAFSVVVDEVQRLVEQLQGALQHILATSDITEATLEELRSAQHDLEASFDGGRKVARG